MSEPRSVAWPPVPIATGRLLLRASEGRDRKVFIELFASVEVGAFIGGGRSREELEGEVPRVPGQRPGVLVVEVAGVMVGVVTLERRDVERVRHGEVGEFELGYLFLPHVWGHGYATEACAAALEWFGGALPGESVVLCTRVANERSMRLAARLGFVEVARFEEVGAEQWLGVRGG
ncbi:GNAT family N-acetyltransferase [Actinokineospora auranticolor]|uniref:RimJ/RimL family protein N-acetyltransferase n=1 Tax=Actinokineospora auranticolor TaxID=155976 RepID=A0A2S6GMU6_9PSEU|nr:GNAT family N-acetyltransferase [Actinokineospora auranticolor]PPK66537.1 RimJ/RimL family protein N-acetyltransferase [Actinokineospora auranticolor]